MGAISNAYLLIFFPLIAAISCHLFRQKITSFIITFFSTIFLFFLSLKIFFDVSVGKIIENDFFLSPISLALEFRFDLLGSIFLILLILIKLVILLFYHSDLKKNLDEKNGRIFYSVFLLNLFSLIGIFSSNNLLNLFIFFEIYSFSFFAIFSITNDFELLKLSFRHFCLNAASSLLILFCFLAIYLTFNEIQFDKIAANFSLILPQYSWFVAIIFFFLSLAFLVKFFPFWLYFEKLKSPNVLANFLTVDLLFIKSLVGIFLLLKFIYFFFGDKLLFDNFYCKEILGFLTILLIFYSAVKIFWQKHLKFIAAYLCLNNLGFILACIALNKIESMQALFFYLLNFTSLNLFIFLFASFTQKHFSNSAISKIYPIKTQYFSLILPLKLSIIFIAAFPLTILFFANWHFALASFSLGIDSFFLIALILSNFVYVGLTMKLIGEFFDKNNKETEAITTTLDTKKYSFYLVSFWLLIIAIYGSIFASNWLNQLSLKFATYFLNS